MGEREEGEQPQSNQTPNPAKTGVTRDAPRVPPRRFAAFRSCLTPSLRDGVLVPAGFPSAAAAVNLGD